MEAEQENGQNNDQESNTLVTPEFPKEQSLMEDAIFPSSDKLNKGDQSIHDDKEYPSTNYENHLTMKEESKVDGGLRANTQGKKEAISNVASATKPKIRSNSFANQPEHFPPAPASSDQPMATSSRSNPDDTGSTEVDNSGPNYNSRRNERSERMMRSIQQVITEIVPDKRSANIFSGVFNAIGPLVLNKNPSRKIKRGRHCSKEVRNETNTKNKDKSDAKQNETSLSSSNAEDTATPNVYQSFSNNEVGATSSRSSDVLKDKPNPPLELQEHSTPGKEAVNANQRRVNRERGANTVRNRRQIQPNTQQNKRVRSDPETGMHKAIDTIFNVVPYIMRSVKDNQFDEHLEISDSIVRSVREEHDDNDKESSQIGGNDTIIPELEINFDSILDQQEEYLKRYLKNDILSGINHKKNVFENITKVLPLFLNFLGIAEVIPRGGISDPCMNAEFYNTGTASACYTTEMDLMYCFGSLNCDINLIEQLDETHPSNVNLVKKYHFPGQLNHEFQSFVGDICTGETIDSEKFTQEANKFRNYLSRNTKFPFRQWAKGWGLIFNVNRMRRNVDIGPYEYIGGDESTFASQFNIGHTPCCVIVNHIPCLKLNFWPAQAKEWLMREADWPTFDQRQVIKSKGCLLVPSSMLSFSGKRQQSWTLLFTFAEKEILFMLNRSQKNILFLMLVLYHKYLRSIGEKQNDCASIRGLSKMKPVFSSDLITTSFFWMCEQRPQQDKDSNGKLYWSEENTLSNLWECLHKFEVFLYNGFLPHYFVRKQNLLEGIDRNFQEIAIEKLQRMKQQLLFYIPYNMKEMHNMFVKQDLYNKIAWVIGLTILNGYTHPHSANFGDIDLD